MYTLFVCFHLPTGKIAIIIRDEPITLGVKSIHFMQTVADLLNNLDTVGP